MDPWYRLDNAGKLYPAIRDSRRTTVFRISADLRAPIHAGRFQESLDALMPRFPYFAVHLKRGVFWYSFQRSKRRVSAERDSKYPCVRFPLRRRGMFPFRVRIWRNRIAVEFSHALSDGTGASVFLRSLVAEYLHREGVPRLDCGELPVPGQIPEKGEYEDAFRRFGDPKIPSPPRLEKAFRLPLSAERAGYYRITTGMMPLDRLKTRASDYECGITEFLISIMLDAMRQLVINMPETLQRKAIAPVRINVPVNLRRHWPSHTMRNFFTSVEPEIDPRLGDWSFEEIVDRTRSYMRNEVDRRYLARRMARSVRGELNTATRILPLFVKDMLLPGIYSALAESQYSSGLSNLGLVQMPAHLSPHVKRFDFIPPPAAAEKVKAAVVTWNNQVHLNFGRVVRPAVVETYVFRRLIEMGIPVKVESN